MTRALARVLNTLAHEIRTPLAVSQGYVRLLLEGRLTTAEEQRSAFERTREALGVIARLCTDMTALGAASDAAPALPERASIGGLMTALESAFSPHAPVWTGPVAAAGAVATSAQSDLVRALDAVATAAFADAPGATRVVVIGGGPDATLTMRVGGDAAVAALPAEPDAPDAAELALERGGFGLALIAAALVLQQHNIQLWTHSDGRGAVAIRIPLVNA